MSIKPYLTEIQIQTKIRELALDIDVYCEQNRIQELQLICVLRGSIHFFSDLTRNLKTDCRYNFIGLDSYGAETSSSGKVQLTYPLPSNLKGKHILVIEDIVDTGLSMKFLWKLLEEQQPETLRLCSLLSKPSRRQTPIHIDYLGFEIEDAFVVGYGLDFNGKYRSLSYIGVLQN